MAEEIHFKVGIFCKFDRPVTLNLTSDDLESHIVDLCQYHILACGYIEFDRTDGRIDGHFFSNSTSHLC